VKNDKSAIQASGIMEGKMPKATGNLKSRKKFLATPDHYT
jgi:hypothetical protein